VTFNAAVTYLPATDANRALLTRLLVGTVYYGDDSRDGLIAVHYRARPKSDPGFLITRSYVGLALFTPQLELLYRYPEPVVSPDERKTSPDYLGVEDPRITRVGDKFVMTYCGSGLDNGGSWRGALCTAESTDLVHWDKQGPMDLRFVTQDAVREFDDSYFDNLEGATGTTRHVNNKDGVLFPSTHDGWYYFLHRPMLGKMSAWAIHLARSRSVRGPWTDLGPIARAKPYDGYADAWLGAGAVPIDLGDGRFLEIYHSGHRAHDGSRLYTLGALLLDLNRLDLRRPSSVVEARVDHFMVPETRWEIDGPYPDSVGNVLFTCGAYERNGDIHILYGGGDTLVMAATILKADLLNALVPVVQP
jgi:beta-1,2-mannobiose phosphorylase / 1,2-beta-oligomannan phosphorylase